MTEGCLQSACFVSFWGIDSLTAVAGELNEVLTAQTSNTNQRDFLVYFICLVQKIKLENAGKRHVFVLGLK